MNFLVVHDWVAVLEQIKAIVAETIPDAVVTCAEDGATARQRLGEEIYDLLIIDLTLPHLKGGAADYRVADDLLKELFKLESLNIPGDVIGLTRDKDALELISTSLGPHVMVMIEQDRAGKWKKYLADKIRYASRATVTRQFSINQHFTYDAMIITALDEEFEPYKEKFDFTEFRYFPGANQFLFADKEGVSRQGIGYSIGKSGQARASSVTQSLLATFRPRLALMSGFCGGVEGKSKIGDLLIFDSSYDWDYGKWTQNEKPGEEPVFLSRPSPVSIDGSTAHRIGRQLVDSDFSRNPKLLRSVESKSKGKLDRFDMDICPAASGSAVVAHNSVIRHIRGLNDSIKAVDMESYGFYFACSHTQVIHPEFMCMKAVADYCDGEKGDEYHQVCSEISCAAAVEIMARYWSF